MYTPKIFIKEIALLSLVLCIAREGFAVNVQEALASVIAIDPATKDALKLATPSPTLAQFFGVTPDTDPKEVKKKYHDLIKKYTKLSFTTQVPTVIPQDINRAWDIIKQAIEAADVGKAPSPEETAQKLAEREHRRQQILSDIAKREAQKLIDNLGESLTPAYLQQNEGSLKTALWQEFLAIIAKRKGDPGEQLGAEHVEAEEQANFWIAWQKELEFLNAEIQRKATEQRQREEGMLTPELKRIIEHRIQEAVQHHIQARQLAEQRAAAAERHAGEMNAGIQRETTARTSAEWHAAAAEQRAAAAERRAGEMNAGIQREATARMHAEQRAAAAEQRAATAERHAGEMNAGIQREATARQHAEQRAAAAEQHAREMNADIQRETTARQHAEQRAAAAEQRAAATRQKIIDTVLEPIKPERVKELMQGLQKNSVPALTELMYTIKSVHQYIEAFAGTNNDLLIQIYLAVLENLQSLQVDNPVLFTSALRKFGLSIEALQQDLMIIQKRSSQR